MTANGYRVSLGGSRNVPNLDNGGNCTSLSVLKTVELYIKCVHYVVWELYLTKNVNKIIAHSTKCI